MILFNRGERIDANADVVLPAAIPGRLKFWEPELLKLPRTHAMVHSKVVVNDKRRLRELDFWFGATTATGAALEKSEAQSPAYTARNRTR